MRDSEREGVNAPDRCFDGDGEEEGFWHERGQCVIMMSLGVYSETDRRRLLYRATPRGCHYQPEVSRDLSTGRTHRKWSHTHTHTRKVYAFLHGYTHRLVFLCSHTHCFSQACIHHITNGQICLTSDRRLALLLLNLTNSSISKWTPLWTNVPH